MEIQTIFAFFTLVGHVVLVLAFIGYAFSAAVRTRIHAFATNFAFIASFFIALISMLGSLYFSDVVGWEPCALCWYQRIIMYPLVIIFAVGVWKQEVSARLYGLIFSAIGLVIAVYQVYLQVSALSGETLEGFCTVFGASDCSELFMLEFGYITFPVLSATAFLYIFLLQLVRGG